MSALIAGKALAIKHPLEDTSESMQERQPREHLVVDKALTLGLIIGQGSSSLQSHDGTGKTLCIVHLESQQSSDVCNPFSTLFNRLWWLNGY